MKIDLSLRRKELITILESRKDPEGPQGCYRWLPGSRTNLYASLDTAIAYSVMGVNREELGETRRLGWIQHINSYIDDYRNDGTYKDVIPRHSPSHANGMVIGALGYLGGQQPFPVRIYDQYNTPEKAVNWLEDMDWSRQWASGFWGGPMMFSTSSSCTPKWVNTVVEWLSENLDPTTGMWRKNTIPLDKYQPLGGFVHIYPIYELHNRMFPYPDKVVEQVLNLQNKFGCWFEGDSFSYLDMDALYAYAAMLRISSVYTEDIRKSTLRYYSYLEEILDSKDIYDSITSHGLLCLASTYGLLNQILTDIFRDSVEWSDIFSSRMLYSTSMVEAV